MNAPADTPKLDTCGCCEAEPSQPMRYNRPGLPALAYRLGTHAYFLRGMLAHLASQAVPDGPDPDAHPLAALTTRASDDPAIALLDAWATVADVLTFYQQRIANEGYLRTATERRSVLELARAIGYELNPGVAASAFLAFTVEDAPGSPTEAIVPEGAKIQSIPAQGQLPQTFETTEELGARAEWNVLRPRLTQPQLLSLDADRLYLKGVTLNLKAGDLLLLVLRSGNSVEIREKRIRRVVVDTELGRTQVDLAKEPPPPPRFAPPPLPAGTIDLARPPLNAIQIVSQVRQRTWRERDLRAFLAIKRWAARDVLRHIATPPAPALPPADEGVFAFRERVSCFGHNAPRWESLPSPENTRGGGGANSNDPYKEPWDGAGRERTIWTNSQGDNYTDADVYLERSLPEALSDSWVIFEVTDRGTPHRQTYRVSTVSEASLVDYGISAKATGLGLVKADGAPLASEDKPAEFKVRKTTAYVQSEGLNLADLPIDEPIEQGATSLMLDRMVLGLRVGQPLALRGEQADAAGVVRNEVAILDDIVHSGGYTTLRFKQGLAYSYIRKTVTLNANVARATHGETGREVLGSGDGAQANQRFVLKRTPLTYISAPTPSGAESTLEVRVNDVLWQEVPSLYGLPAHSQSYVVRHDDDGKVALIFGDGISGARLPTGRENVVATYRSGIGPGGEVDAGSLTLLQTRPLGIREVTNPLPAGGAAAPETLTEARTNAPLTVLTLDRIVSLQDFEHFARAFAGIGKAQAVSLWDGETRLVHLTVAAANGEPLDPNSELSTALIKAVDAARDPAQRVRIDSFQPLFFNVAAKVLVDPRYSVATVLADVEAALHTAFAFAKRSFGQAVTAAEVVTMIQKVPGVVATDLDRLYRVTDPPSLRQVLPAAIARRQGNDIQPAQLLLLNPAGITLVEMTP
jgi:predicted phage baseplate assembly protein